MCEHMLGREWLQTPVTPARLDNENPILLLRLFVPTKPLKLDLRLMPGAACLMVYQPLFHPLFHTIGQTSPSLYISYTPLLYLTKGVEGGGL